MLPELNDKQQERIEKFAQLPSVDSKIHATRRLLKAAISALPNRNMELWTLSDLDIASCERVDDDLIRIELVSGRVFFGQRSEYKQYRIYNNFRSLIKTNVTPDGYKLAMDIAQRYRPDIAVTVGERYFRPNGVFIEGGCFTGIKAISWADTASPKKIIAVEIGKRNFEILQMNIEANGLGDVITPVHAGLWKEDGHGEQLHSYSTRRFLVSTDRWQDYLQKTEPVRLLCIDSLIQEYDLDFVDYLNIQVNGAELEVCHGIDQALDSIRVIGIASYYSIDGEPLADQVQDYMLRQGCTLLSRSDAGRLTFLGRGNQKQGDNQEHA